MQPGLLRRNVDGFLDNRDPRLAGADLGLLEAPLDVRQEAIAAEKGELAQRGVSTLLAGSNAWAMMLAAELGARFAASNS